jgi:hypothetical protein
METAKNTSHGSTQGGRGAGAAHLQVDVQPQHLVQQGLPVRQQRQLLAGGGGRVLQARGGLLQALVRGGQLLLPLPHLRLRAQRGRQLQPPLRRILRPACRQRRGQPRGGGGGLERQQGPAASQGHWRG